MKTEWRILYKCRLCGALEGNTVGSYQTTSDAIREACVHGQSRSSGIPVTMVKPHHCQNGATGVADLQGTAEYPVKE